MAGSADGEKMQLESYFDFYTPTDIRVKGTRVGIETILLDYLDLGLSPEEIAQRYPVLTLEQVFATLTYYWRYQSQVDTYLATWKAHGEQQRRLQAANPPTIVRRLQALAQQQQIKPEKLTSLPI
jgi:uncharacterized protein (DUF433 family)